MKKLHTFNHRTNYPSDDETRLSGRFPARDQAALGAIYSGAGRTLVMLYLDPNIFDWRRSSTEELPEIVATPQRRAKIGVFIAFILFFSF